MIRSILDANIWISFLLGVKKEGTIAQVASAAFSTTVALIVPQELIAELNSVVTKSPYISTHVRKDNLDELISRFHTFAIIVPVLPQHSRFVRDQKDDYLISYSLAHAVDYLVTGDQDLLALSKIDKLQIVTPNQYLEIVK